MKLGIKTTDGISKLKLKTADGISKAVPCACCDPCSGLWGPGYDDLPMQLTMNGSCVLGRVSKCLWVSTVCYTEAGENSTAYVTQGYCPPEYNDVAQTNVELWYGWDDQTGQQVWNLRWDLTVYYGFTNGHPCTGPPFPMYYFYGTKMQNLESPLGVYTWTEDEYTITVT